MKDYVIFTDSACDIESEILDKWGVRSTNLTLRFTDSEEEFEDGKVDIKEFYDHMRSGRVAKTSAVNASVFEEAFEEILKEGKDVIYVGFSSGLSTTFNSARLATQTLSAKYPESKLIAVDSLAASAGFGLLIYLAVEKKNSGATIEELAEYVEGIKLNICHWFTVDDLVYLKRGGRVSAATAFFGNLASIKPVMHVDNEGHLVKFKTARGRKGSIAELADKLGETIIDKENPVVYISHADCMKDVEYLESLLESKYGIKVNYVTNVGAVIGAHSGPGTLALFFVGKER